MSEHDFTAALHMAHVQGKGEAVAEIWRKISRRELSDEDTLAWTKAVSEWIASTDPTSTLSGEVTPEPFPLKATQPLLRVARIHAALTVSGWAEPMRDSLSDEHQLLQFAMKPSNIQRAAATAVWGLIAAGKASQGTREQWLDFVARGICQTKLPDNANRRGEALLAPLGLSGRDHGMREVLVRLMLPLMIAVPKYVHSDSSKGHTEALRRRLQAIGAIPENLTPEEEAWWERLIRDEKRKNL